MAEVPLQWRINQTGAEAVKARLQELNSQFKQGQITQEQYTKGLKEVKKEANNLTLAQSAQTATFKAARPALTDLNRVMSSVNTVMARAVTAFNAINIAFIALQTNKNGLAEMQSQAKEIERQMRLLEEAGLANSDAYRELEGDWNELNTQMEELKRSTDQTAANNLFAVGTALAYVGTTLVQFFTRPDILTKLPGLFKGLGGTIAGAIGSLGGTLIAQAIKEFLLDPIFSEFANWRDTIFKAELDRFFLETIPNAFLAAGTFINDFFQNQIPAMSNQATEYLRTQFVTDLTQAFVTAWNGVIGVTNSAVAVIVQGIEGFANAFIDAVNSVIRAYNRLPIKPFGNIGTLGKISLGVPSLPFIAAAQGFHGEVSQPTLILAGEAGRERVDISPNGSGGGNTYIYVAGTVAAESQLLELVDNYNKREFKRRGRR